MTGGRPWLYCVWERRFATEDEADEFYEFAMAKWDEPPLEVDRFDGLTVRVYVRTKDFEDEARRIEHEHLRV